MLSNINDSLFINNCDGNKELFYLLAYANCNSLIVLLKEHLIDETLWQKNFIFEQTSSIPNVDFTFTFLYLISNVGDDNDGNADSH